MRREKMFSVKNLKKTPMKVCIQSFSQGEFDERTATFSGIFSQPMNSIFNLCKSYVNLTVIPSREEITLINNETGAYSGCFGKLQQGQADIAAYPMTMPIIGIENITQLNVSAFEKKMYILAPYSASSSVQNLLNDALDQLNAFSLEVWSHVLIMTLIFWTLMLSIQRLYDHYSDVFGPSQENDPLFGQSLSYQVTTHMLQTETCDYLRFRERFISILMSMFAFLLITFFSNMVTTEQISIKAYFAFDSYERILANKSIQPTWVGVLNDHQLYQNAPVGSEPRKIWDQSAAISKKHVNRNSVTKFDPIDMMEIATLSMKQEVVVFATSLHYDTFIRGMCLTFPAIPGLKDIRVIGKEDIHIPPQHYAIPVSRNSKVSSIAEHLVNLIAQHGIGYDRQVIEEVQQFMLKYTPRARFDENYFECLEHENFPKGRSKTISLKLNQFLSLFYFYAALIILAFVFLLREKLTKLKKKSKVSPSRLFKF